MNARTMFYLAAALALVGTLSTCHPVKAQTNEALRAYIVTLPEAMQREPQAIRAALKRPVITESVTNVVRSTRQQEIALKNLVVANLLTDAQWQNVALRDERIDNALDTKMGRAGLTDAEFIALAKIKARVELLRARILRAGGDPTGPLSGQASESRPIQIIGPPRWQALGLAELPTLDAIRGAQR